MIRLLIVALLVSPAGAEEVPAVIVKLVKAYRGDTRPGREQEGAENAKQFLEENYVPVARDFTAAWTKYDARRAEVTKALEAAAALEADKKLDEAIAALKAVITIVPADAKGALPEQRAFLEARDAEVPAILAWAKLAAAKKDVYAVPEIAAALYTRRKVTGDPEAEKLLWVIKAQASDVATMTVNRNDADEVRVGKLLYGVRDSERAGQELAWGYYFAADKQLGLKRARYEDSSHGKKGEWVIIDVPLSKLAGVNYKYSETNKYTVPINCVLTNRITGIDPVTGSVRYAEKCDFKEVTEKFEIKAALAAAPPAWAKPSADNADDDPGIGAKVTLIALVEHGGPKWVLTKAQVADFRFLGRAMTGGIPDLMRSITQPGAGD